MIVAERLADLIWRVHEGDHADLRRLLGAMGAAIEEDEGAWSAVRPDGLRVGFLSSGMDHQSAMASTVLALWGPLGFGLDETRAAGRLVQRRATEAARRRREAAGRTG